MPKVDHDQQAREVHPVAPRQGQGLATDLAVELAKGNQRAGEGDHADQDADVDLDFVDRLFGRVQGHADAVHQVVGRARIEVVGKADQRGGQTDQAVHERNQFRHLRHLHGACGVQADAAAHGHGTDDPDVAVGHPRTDDGGEHSQRHADDAVEVAPA